MDSTRDTCREMKCVCVPVCVCVCVCVYVRVTVCVGGMCGFYSCATLSYSRTHMLHDLLHDVSTLLVTWSVG
jgi:hypothetical protein